MKKPIYILIALLAGVSLTSCKDWLDVRPGTEVLQDELFSTEEGFNEAILGAYLQMGTGLYADNLTMTTISAMGQNYQTTATGHPFREHALYNYVHPDVKSTVATIWSNMYTAIGGVNNLLEHVDDAKSIFRKKHYNLVKGQALGLRAYMHFDLLRMFGPLPLNNEAKTAIPYVTAFDNKVTDMSTFSEVIEKCIKDLDEAEQLLSVDQDIAYDNGDNQDEFNFYSRNHFNYWTAKALKARIYLYAGNKEKALKYAQEVIASGKFPFVNRTTFNQTSNQDRTFSTEHIFALNQPLMKTLVDKRFRLEGNTSFQTTSFFLSTNNMNNLYEIANGGSTDYRYLYHIRPANGYSYSTKFWQDGITKLELANQMPMIRVSEMYYIAAEATPDIEKSRDWLNEVRSHRGLLELTSNFNETIKMQELAKEYNKEFYAEGQTFFYYKRLGILTIPRATVALKESSFIFPLPDSEIEFGNR